MQRSHDFSTSNGTQRQIRNVFSNDETNYTMRRQVQKSFETEQSDYPVCKSLNNGNFKM